MGGILQSEPDFFQIPDRRVPAYHLLEVLGLAADPIRGVTEINRFEIADPAQDNHASVIRVQSDGSTPLEGSLSILSHELGSTDTFDLLVNSQGRLIAIFPVLPENWRTEASHKDYRYLDLRPYYLERFSEPAIQEQIEWLRSEIERDEPWFEAYQRWAQPGQVILPTVVRPLLYFHAKESLGVTVKTLLPKPILEPLQESPEAMLSVLFPFVYNPDAAFNQRADAAYHQKILSHASGEAMPPWLGERLPLRPGASVLVGGSGNGLDSWLAWLVTRNTIDAFDVNPFAVANTRAVGGIASFSVNAVVSDNLEDAEGHEVFPGKRYDVFLWNMPLYTKSGGEQATNGVVFFRQRFDGDRDGKALIRMAAALPRRLNPGGAAMLWNMPFGPEQDEVWTLLRENSGLGVEKVVVPNAAATGQTALYIVRAPQNPLWHWLKTNAQQPDELSRMGKKIGKSLRFLHEDRQRAGPLDAWAVEPTGIGMVPDSARAPRPLKSGEAGEEEKFADRLAALRFLSPYEPARQAFMEAYPAVNVQTIAYASMEYLTEASMPRGGATRPFLSDEDASWLGRMKVDLFELGKFVPTQQKPGFYLPSDLKRVMERLKLLPQREGLRLLDLGSGTGEVLWVAAHLGFWAQGFELSSELFRESLRRLKQFEETLRIPSGRVNIRNTDFRDAPFDTFDVIHYFSHGADRNAVAGMVEKILAELKPGASLMVSGVNVRTRIDYEIELLPLLLTDQLVFRSYSDLAMWVFTRVRQPSDSHRQIRAAA